MDIQAGILGQLAGHSVAWFLDGKSLADITTVPVRVVSRKKTRKHNVTVFVSPRMRGAVHTKRNTMVLVSSSLRMQPYIFWGAVRAAPWRLHWLRADDVIPALPVRGYVAAPRARGGGCPPMPPAPGELN